MSKRIIAPIAALLTFLVPALALAAPEGGAAPVEVNQIVAVAMALAIGLAALGGGLGQGRAAAAALEGICRNPSSAKEVFTPMLLGLAFIESLVIFALVIAFMLNGKV
ncbi:MAG: ATP synthase F0 subunit C [Myxococcales bacterium]|nr:ATP synthase F0 subunit C [Myxococcales bacterium]MCA9696604.1 ATP synthase F0 subunit C [Myxococcales bacterium]